MKLFSVFLICVLFSNLGFSAETSLSLSPRPEKINDEGDYIYKGEKQAEALYYKVDDLPPIKGAFYLRFGTIGPYDITGDSGTTFQQMYSDNSSFVVVLEQELLLKKAAVDLSVTPVQFLVKNLIF
jgi:hypothetical protein